MYWYLLRKVRVFTILVGIVLCNAPLQLFAQSNSASNVVKEDSSIAQFEESNSGASLEASSGVREQDLAIATDSDEQRIAVQTVGVGDVLRMLIVLGVVVGVLYGVILLLRKAGGATAQYNEELIHIVASRALHQAQHLHVVRIGTQVYVIAATGQHMSLIDAIDDKETIDEVHMVESRSATTAPRNKYFSKVLSAVIDRYKKKQGAESKTPQMQDAMPGTLIRNKSLHRW